MTNAPHMVETETSYNEVLTTIEETLHVLNSKIDVQKGLEPEAVVILASQLEMIGELISLYQQMHAAYKLLVESNGQSLLDNLPYEGGVQ